MLACGPDESTSAQDYLTANWFEGLLMHVLAAVYAHYPLCIKTDLSVAVDKQVDPSIRPKKLRQ